MRVRRWMRILAFATVYFIIHLIFFILFIMQRFTGTPEASWYLQHPLEALRIMIFELGDNPILIIPFFLLAFYALIFGFVTDLALSFLKRHVRLRKQGAE